MSLEAGMGALRLGCKPQKYSKRSYFHFSTQTPLQTDGRTDERADGRVDGRVDKASSRVACPQLKKEKGRSSETNIVFVFSLGQASIRVSR